MKKLLPKNKVLEIFDSKIFKHLFQNSMIFFNMSSYDVKLLKVLLNSINLKFIYFINYIGICNELQNQIVFESKNKTGLIVLISFSEFSDLAEFGLRFEKFLFELNISKSTTEITPDFNLIFSASLTKFCGEFFSYCINSTLFSKFDFFNFYYCLNQNCEISESIIVKNKLIFNILNDLNKAIPSIF